MNRFQNATDDELISLYANGCNEAFDQLLDKYQSKIYSYIYYAVHDEDAANDIFQETFVKVLTSIQDRKYVPSGKFQAWVTRIAHNIIMDSYRQTPGEELIIMDDEEENRHFAYEPIDSCFETTQIAQQTLSEVEKLYKMLPKAQSEIIFMRFYQDLSFKEIADELGISINTALGRVRYALINIRKIAESKNISLSLG